MALRQSFGSLRRAVVPVMTRYTASYLQVSSQGFSANAEALDSEVKTKSGWGGTKVYDVLKAKPSQSLGSYLWVPHDAMVIEAVRKMTENNVGSLLVYDLTKDGASHVADAVVGIVTERDYLTKVVVVGKNSSSLKVSEIMTPESKLKTVNPDNSVLDVMTMMMSHNFRHVPVVGSGPDSGKYLGMLSIRDVVGIMLQEHHAEVENLNEYITGTY